MGPTAEAPTMADDWTATIAGERMKLDEEFADEVRASSFDRQQWGLVMTALEFDIEDPSDPAEAELVPDTTNLPTIMPELESVGQQGPMGAGGRPGGSGGSSGSGGGLVDSVKGALGLGGEDAGEDERLDEARELATEYCDRLQGSLEANGRWEAVCRQARG